MRRRRGAQEGAATGRPTCLIERRNSFQAAAAADGGRRRGATCTGTLRGLADLSHRGWQFFVRHSFSSLTRRIVFLNLAGLLALVIGILYLSQFRAGLIEARIQSLLVQGEIIAGAIAASATAEHGHHRVRSRPAARTAGRRKLRAVGRNAVGARVLDQSGAGRAGAAPAGVADQDPRPHLRPRRRAGARQPQSLRRRRAALRPAAAERRSPACWSASTSPCAPGSSRGDLPLYHELGPQNGKGYEEVVARRSTGYKSSMVRINERGEVIVSVAVPVQRFRAVRGALMLSTQGADIDDMRGRRAAGDPQGVPGRGRRDDRAVVPARRHHRGSGAPARRRRRAGAPAHPLAGRDSRLHRRGATRSAICPARCAT